MEASAEQYELIAVNEPSTFQKPFQPPAGIEKDFVNGSLVWDSGKPTGPRRPRPAEVKLAVTPQKPFANRATACLLAAPGTARRQHREQGQQPCGHASRIQHNID